ncbi:MAG: Methyltransferase [Arenicellales bacterium IbO2]|nr:site-specific DNA-methyltransferase [Gammaproteobacteria bacterium]MDA8009746.1 site-specific DNA-methyltransferase [Alphaproteobacteria bacterium]CAJ2377644.1 MAG: Methyltransferase [Arenicellales bacterium IbO2]
MSTKSNCAAEKNAATSRRANLLSGAEWLQRSFSVWRDLDKSGEERKLKHPAMFTLKLVERILETYSRKAGVLLDPFAGSGTALLAALNSNMEAIGLDINPGYRQCFEGRADLFGASRWHYHVLDARRLGDVVPPESVDICVTSPPYWDILNRRRTADGKAARPYTDSANDLGNMAEYEEFLLSLGEILSAVRAALKPRAYLVLNVMDLRKGSVFYPLHMDATNVARKSGFELQDIIIWDRQKDYNSMRPLGYPHKFIINKVHEYLLVFR